jgi:hypothetical protein
MASKDADIGQRTTTAMARLEEVFGIATKPVLSYIERSDVDGSFVDAVSSDHHILIYGASKQGKTALRQKHVDEGRCEIYRCSPKTTPESIYQHILRKANIQIETSEQITASSKLAGNASWSIKAKVPVFAEATVGTEGGGERGNSRLGISEFVDVDLSDAQVVASMLDATKFQKFVVLENFHYLRKEIQRLLSFDLKTFHEMSLRFIILGVWREANHLLVLNPDLQDRVAEVAVEPWENTDFGKLIDVGQNHLNVVIPDKARQEFMANAYGNVGMVQEFLRTYCKLNEVHETSIEKRDLDSTHTISETLDKKAEDQRGRLLTVLESISGKSRADRREGAGEPLTLPYYLVKVLLSVPFNELASGITRTHLLEKIREIHRRPGKETIRVNDVAHLLKRLPALQDGSASPFLFYDSNSQRLRIIDAGLLFALAKVDRTALSEEILDPLESYDDDDSPVQAEFTFEVDQD